MFFLECLIKTYTNKFDTGLDHSSGSGSTGVACTNTTVILLVYLDRG